MASTDRHFAVMTGASRGVGKGIAIALGRAGHLVYLVGRGSQRRNDEAELPGSLAETATRIAIAGGKAVTVPCDLASDTQIGQLFERLKHESGGLDLLVNNAIFLHSEMSEPKPFWEKSEKLADIIAVGLRCHYLAMRHAIPLMLDRQHPLIVNISFFCHAGMHDPAYYAAKAGLDAMAAGAAGELAAAGVTCVSLWPGMVATERLLSIMEQVPHLCDQLPPLESTDFVGRVIAALRDDDELRALNGKSLIAAQLAQRYGLTLEDGSVPPSLRGQLGEPHPRNDTLRESI